MGKRLRLEDNGNQERIGGPQPRTEVNIAVDLSRSQWVDCVRWEGAAQLRLSTSSEIKPLRALVGRYEGCRVRVRLRRLMQEHGRIGPAPRAGMKRAIIAVTRRLVVRLRARWLEALAEGRVAAA